MTTDKAAAPVGAVPQGDGEMAVKSPMTAHLIYLLHQLSPVGYDQRTVDDAAFHLRTLWHRAEKAEAALASQAARMGELEQDAARYRWLRDWSGTELAVRRRDYFPQSPTTQFTFMSGRQLDAAIDAAMSGGVANG